MFIDDKIKEYIEHEKKECKEIWEKIKDEIKRDKELNKYLSSYENDSIHQELKKDFDKVLDNIESLANIFIKLEYLILENFLMIKRCT